jgi:hypothetical protein
MLSCCCEMMRYCDSIGEEDCGEGALYVRGGIEMLLEEVSVVGRRAVAVVGLFVGGCAPRACLAKCGERNPEAGGSLYFAVGSPPGKSLSRSEASSARDARVDTLFAAAIYNGAGLGHTRGHLSILGIVT